MKLFYYFLAGAIFVLLVETTYLVIKTTKKSHQTTGKRKIYVDTSALMDGRILKVAETGFLADNLIIPRSVIRELQLLADGKDSEKRERARFGMEVARDLERVVYCNVEILQDELDRTPVDERLLQLAKENHGVILSNDYNLQKVAETEKIDVLNVNNLASNLRSDYLPGDTFMLKITSKGSNAKQGVGYLPDGTMVVVDNAHDKIGHEVKVEFEKFIQTNSGRMMFAKNISNQKSQTKPQANPRSTRFSVKKISKKSQK